MCAVNVVANTVLYCVLVSNLYMCALGMWGGDNSIKILYNMIQLDN